MKALTHEQFIKKAKKTHGNRYDYSITKYKNARTKVVIICKIHGKFKQKTSSHLDGFHCRKCGYETIKVSKKEFIKRAKKKFGSYFDYSQVNFKSMEEHVIIICPIHGKFRKKPRKFIDQIFGCNKCTLHSPIHLSGAKKGKKRIYDGNYSGPRFYTQNEYLEKAIKKHGKKFNYSETRYKRWNKKVVIICKIHGRFSLRPEAHLFGQGCKKCQYEFANSLSTEEFIKMAKEKFGSRFDYSNVKYKRWKARVTIICKKHNLSFTQAPQQHLNKRITCRKCMKEIMSPQLRLTIPELKGKIKKTHGILYSYPYLEKEYKGVSSKITITCKKHGKFNQAVSSHLWNKAGCPTCNESFGEKTVRRFLKDQKIKYIPEWKDHDCVVIRKLEFDFYLPELNCIIEYDGKQHYEPNNFFGGQKGFLALRKRDKIKNKWAKKNKIKMIRVKYDELIIPYLYQKLKIH